MPYMRNTNRLIFKYFNKLKAYKYLVRPQAKVDIMTDTTISEISNILNTSDLTEQEQNAVIFYGMKGHAPRRKNSDEYTDWVNAIHKIHNRLLKARIITGDEWDGTIWR